MKKLTLISLSIICMVLAGCEDDKYYTSFSSSSDFDGIWMCVDDSDKYYNCAYSYDIKGDKLEYHQHHGYIDKNNYFVCESDDSWEKTTVLTFMYEFDTQEQALYIGGTQMGKITRTGKDKALFSSTFSLLRSCALQRVKGVKFSQGTDEKSDTSSSSSSNIEGYTTNPFVQMVNDSTVHIILPPNDEIWYTSLTNDTLPFPKHGGTIISNTYIDGKGVYKFSAPITGDVFVSDGCFKVDTFLVPERNQRIDKKSLHTSLIFPSSIKSLNRGGALSGLAYCEYLVFPNTLTSMGTDLIWMLGNRANEVVHVFLTNPTSPNCNWREFWNFPTSKGVIFHYPKGSDYSEFIHSLDDDMKAYGCDIAWPHSWQPTTYYFE